MPLTVRIKFNPEALTTLTKSPDGLLGRWMYDRGTVVQLAAIRQCPKRTFKLAESIVKRWSPTLNGQMMIIGAYQPYAIFVHEGTGIYGKNARPITPKSAQALRWLGPDGTPIFARSVKGMKANHFLSDNLPLFIE
jgi:hypothetical protein